MNAAAVTTVTVQALEPTTYVQQPTSFVVHNAPTTVQGGFCATITMEGPGLPRAAQGQCGTILLVAEGMALEAFSLVTVTTTALLHVALGRMFR